MASDIVDHPQTGNSAIKNYTIVVGAPKAATTNAYGSNFTIDATINDAASLGDLQTRLDNRFDDRNYNGLAE